MINKSWRILVLLVGILALAILGCSASLKTMAPLSGGESTQQSFPTIMVLITPIQNDPVVPSVIPPTSAPSSTDTPAPTITPLPTDTAQPTNTPLPTDTPAPTDTPLPTETSLPITTPYFGYNAPGQVYAPILMYHHISDDDLENRYFTTVQDFRDQMNALKYWGYTTITASTLAEVIINGGDLPDRPVVLTFDDGYDDVYQNALPIMNELGFVGTMYVYVSHAGIYPYISYDHISALAQNGWEIGSHSMSHYDLTKNHSTLDYEVNQSRQSLEDILGVTVTTFSYPYGYTDDYVTNYVRDSGYIAAVGLGFNWQHTTDTLFELDRIEVENGNTLSTFAELIPWSY